MYTPLFITGTMRAGTTVLYELLRASLPQSISLDSHDFEDRVFWHRAGLAMGGALTGTYCRAAGPHEVTVDQERFADAVRHVCERNDRCIVSKNPHLVNKLGFVCRLFPEARIVVIVRQAVSVVASTKLHFERSFRGEIARSMSFTYYWPERQQYPCWWVIPTHPPPPEQPLPHDDPTVFRAQYPDPSRYFPGEGFQRIPESWCRINANVVRQRERWGLHKRLLFVNYHDLVHRTHTTLQQILAFADVPEANVARLPSHLDKSREHSWKDVLSEHELAICEAVQNECASEVALIEQAMPDGPTFWPALPLQPLNS